MLSGEFQAAVLTLTALPATSVSVGDVMLCPARCCSSPSWSVLSAARTAPSTVGSRWAWWGREQPSSREESPAPRPASTSTSWPRTAGPPWTRRTASTPATRSVSWSYSLSLVKSLISTSITAKLIFASNRHTTQSQSHNHNCNLTDVSQLLWLQTPLFPFYKYCWIFWFISDLFSDSFYSPQAPLNSRVSSGQLFLEGGSSLESAEVCVEWDSTDDFVYRCHLAEEQKEAEGYQLECEESLKDTRCT